ncbi:MAG: transposase [Chthoniobacteraceae bacterium]
MSLTTEQTNPNKVQRRRYDEQFKRDAVALLEAGRGATQLARELGVSQWNLRDWKEVFGTGGAAAGLPARRAQPVGGGAAGAVAHAVELAGLRRELDAVCRQRDILKKALAIVAQEHPHASR